MKIGPIRGGGSWSTVPLALGQDSVLLLLF